jgi:hypothetical protein
VGRAPTKMPAGASDQPCCQGLIVLITRLSSSLLALWPLWTAWRGCMAHRWADAAPGDMFTHPPTLKRSAGARAAPSGCPPYWLLPCAGGHGGFLGPGALGPPLVWPDEQYGGAAGCATRWTKPVYRRVSMFSLKSCGVMAPAK